MDQDKQSWFKGFLKKQCQGPKSDEQTNSTDTEEVVMHISNSRVPNLTLQ